MKIVHIITRFILGGADENTLFTCNGQAEEGNEVWLIYGRDFEQSIVDRLDPRVHRCCVPTLLREIDALNDFKCLFALVSLLRSIGPDVVHTHESKAGIIGRIAAWMVPGVHVVHGIHIASFQNVGRGKGLVFTILEKVAAIQTRAFVSVSKPLVDAYKSKNIGLDRPYYVVESGMDTDQYKLAQPYSTEEMSGILGVKCESDWKYIVVSGTLERRKRVFEMIESLAPLFRLRSDIKVIAVGDGKERQRIDAGIASMGLGASCFTVGYRSDLDRLIKTSSLCVHTAEHEGLPRVVIQYVLAGRPAVVMDLPGIEILVEDGVNGYVIDSGNFTTFREKVADLFNNPQRLQAFAAASARRDLSAWGKGEMVRKINMIYKDIGAFA